MVANCNAVLFSVADDPVRNMTARLDGATMWQTYWHVLLPIARPATITAAMLSFVYHWQDFLDPLIYLSDFTTYPISLGLRMYQSMAGTWANLMMATSLIALVPVAIVFFLCDRHLMRGLGVVQMPGKSQKV